MLEHLTGSEAHAVGLVDPVMGSPLAWSPTRDRLTYISDGGLTVVNADGTGKRQLVPPSVVQANGVQAIAWSPDGKWVAYEDLDRQSSRPPREQGLWRVTVDARVREQVYLNPDPGEINSHLAGWSPDGRYLLYWQSKQMSSSLEADGDPLAAIRVVAGHPSRIVPLMLTYRDFLDWSPNGSQLALIAGSGRETWVRKRLVVTSLNGVLHPLSDAREAVTDPAWSPDGRWIAVAGEPVTPAARASASIPRAIAGRRIWRIAADGSSRQVLTSPPGFQDEHPLWSADGRSILFARIHDGQAQLWLMRADGSGQHRVVDVLSPISSGYYGHLPWELAYDWWSGARQARVPSS
ncbi:MAG: hypothetical protein ACR2JC_19220 [Chloroflexota bacterium]